MALGVACTLAAGWYFDFLRQPYKPVEEAKICYSALTSAKTLAPQTREYLKGRLYWNAARWISPDWLEGWHIDFGPVNDTNLAGIVFVKDAVSNLEIYQEALQKHPRAASKP